MEAIFDDVSLADIGQEVRLVADFLHLAWCRSLEAAAAYSTFDAPAAMALAKVARQNLPDATEFLLMDGTKAVPFAPPKFFLQYFDRLCVAAHSGMSIAQLDSVDRAVLDAVGARVEEGYFCGAAFPVAVVVKILDIKYCSHSSYLRGKILEAVFFFSMGSPYGPSPRARMMVLCAQRESEMHRHLLLTHKSPTPSPLGPKLWPPKALPLCSQCELGWVQGGSSQRDSSALGGA